MKLRGGEVGLEKHTKPLKKKKKKKKKRQNSSKHYGPAETMFTCRFLAIAEKATNNFNEENKLIAFVDF